MLHSELSFNEFKTVFLVWIFQVLQLLIFMVTLTYNAVRIFILTFDKFAKALWEEN